MLITCTVSQTLSVGEKNKNVILIINYDHNIIIINAYNLHSESNYAYF